VFAEAFQGDLTISPYGYDKSLLIVTGSVSPVYNFTIVRWHWPASRVAFCLMQVNIAQTVTDLDQLAGSPVGEPGWFCDATVLADLNKAPASGPA